MQRFLYCLMQLLQEFDPEGGNPLSAGPLSKLEVGFKRMQCSQGTAVSPGVLELAQAFEPC